MEIGDKFEALVRLKFLPMKKVIRIGDSYGIVLPRPMIDWVSTKIGDHRWVELRITNEGILLRPPSEEYIKSVEFEEVGDQVR